MSSVTAETAEVVSRIAFGFMASKALFAALHVDLFSHLSGAPKDEQALADAAGAHIRMEGSEHIGKIVLTV